jgi:hypothetical protein
MWERERYGAVGAFTPVCIATVPNPSIVTCVLVSPAARMSMIIWVLLGKAFTDWGR